jgi:hypothetical protein
MAAAPNFAATVRVSAANIATADTSRTSPTNVGTVFTAGASGSRIDEINIVSTGTTTAGVVRLWVYTGSTYYLLQEVMVTDVTPSTTQAVFSSTSTYNNFMLPSGHSLRATTNNSESFNVIAFGGDF